MINPDHKTEKSLTWINYRKGHQGPKYKKNVNSSQYHSSRRHQGKKHLKRKYSDIQMKNTEQSAYSEQLRNKIEDMFKKNVGSNTVSNIMLVLIVNTCIIMIIV